MHRFQATPTALPSPKTLRAYALIATPLCAVAGALNAIGFIAFAYNTSHVTGNWTRTAAELGEGHVGIFLRFLGLTVAFLVGAMISTLLVEHDLSQNRRLRYLKPLLGELFVIAVIYGLTLRCPSWAELPFAGGILLALAMGLQNATITKASGAAVRTTHMTGTTTDLGIEISRVILLVREYVRRRRSGEGAETSTARDVKNILVAELAKAAFLASMLGSFVTGAAVGGFAFARLGVHATLVPAAGLAALIAVELIFYRADLAGAGTDRLSPVTGRWPRQSSSDVPPPSTATITTSTTAIAPAAASPAPAPAPTPPTTTP